MTKATKLIFGMMLALSVYAKADNIPVEMKCLWSAYPDQFTFDTTREQIVFKDGARMPYIDNVKLDYRYHFNEIVDNVQNLAQMFLIDYPKGYKDNQNPGRLHYNIPGENEDPGRIRYEPFFRKLYGNKENEVNLVRVKWPLSKAGYEFNSKKYLRTIPTAQGQQTIELQTSPAKALEQVSAELDSLIARKPEYKIFLKSMGGTFKWRVVDGTKYLSMHSFGIAIDINADEDLNLSRYWRRDNQHIPDRRNPAPYTKDINKIPLEIAEIFERHNFIWGGKWYRYDTMHFEYRPELMMEHRQCEDFFDKYYQGKR